MATWNGANFLHEQLCSLLGQTRQPDEVVICDDGSSDDTLVICREFARSVNYPVRIYSNSVRKGFSDNFLNTAQLCEHELIAFCDQDDVWLPEKLDLMARRITADSSLLSMHTLTVTDQNLRPIGFEWKQGIQSDSILEPLEINPFGTGWGNTMMFRREVLDLIPAERRPRQPDNLNLPLSHDSWILALCAALGRVSQIDKPLVLYRQHENTITTWTSPRSKDLMSPIRVPLGEYRSRRSFDRAMGQLLKELADRSGPMADAATQAAACFRDRIAIWDARIGLFEEETFQSRLRSYFRHQRLMGAKKHRFASRIKDLLLGVTGYCRIIDAQIKF